MAGPGGIEVGRVSIRVVADASGIVNDVRRAVKTAEEQVKNIAVGFDVDPSQLASQVRQAVNTAQQTAGTIDTGFNVDQSSLISGARRSVNQAEALAGTIRVPIELERNAIAKLTASITSLTTSVGGAAGRMVGSFSKIAGSVGTISTAVLGILPSIASLGAAAGQAAVAGGALTAAMGPAVLGAIGTSAGVLVTVFKGMEAAFTSSDEAFEEFISDLPANTAAAATEINALAKQVKSLGPGIQESFWAAAGGVSSLQVLMGPLQESMLQLASSMGSVTGQFISYISQGAGFTAVNTLIRESSAAASNLFQALGQVLQAFTAIGAAAAPIFTSLTESLAGWAANWNAKIQGLYQSGGLTTYLQDALAKVQALGEFFGQLGSIVSGVFTAMNAAGVPFLGLIGTVVSSTAQWVNSSEGMSTLVNMFSQAQAAVTALLPVFGSLVGVIANTLVPIISTIIQTIAPGMTAFIQGLGGMLTNLAPAIQVVAGWFNTLLQAISPLLPTIGSLINSGIMWLNSVFQSLSPVIQTVVNWFSQFIGKVVEVATNLWQQMSPAINEAKRLLSEVLGAALQWLTGLWEKLSPILSTVADQLGGTLTNAVTLLTGVWNQFSPLLQFVADLFGSVLAEALKLIVPLINGIIDGLKNMMGQLPPMGDAIAALKPWLDTIKDIFNTLAPIVVDLAQKLGEVLFYAIGKLVDPLKKLGEFVKKLWDAIKPTVLAVAEFAEKFLNALKPAIDFVVEAFKFLLDVISPLIDALKWLLQPVNWLIGLLGDLVEWVGKVLGVFAGWLSKINEASEAAGGFWNALGNGLSEIGGKIVEWFRDLPSKIVEKIKSIGTDLYDAGKSILTSFFNGMTETFNGAIDKVGEMMQSVRDFFPFSPAKVGPFSGRGWVVYSGESIGEAFSEGMIAKSGLVASAARSMAQDAVRQFRGLQASVSPQYNGRSTNASISVGQIVAADPEDAIRRLQSLQFKTLVRSGAI